MRRLYVSAPVDEVRLAEAVAPVVTGYGGRLPTTAELDALARDRGLDFATMTLFQALRAAPADRAFIEAVDAEPILSAHPPADARIVLIPALFNGHYPETGADAKFVAEVARQCGFDAVTLPVRSVAPSSVNAEVILESLSSETAQKLWVFTVSKGTADFRLFLQRYPDHPAQARIRGWISVCGIVSGCQIADWDTATVFRRLKYALICRLFGTGYQLMRELRTDHAVWKEPITHPPGWKKFNFIAVPLGAHIQTSLIGRYLAIAPQGPNDGMVLCLDAILDGGPCYPVWGCDHFFCGPQVIPLLYRFFAYLRRL